jgi:UDP-N-acetylglucosamine 1-carboxyvinyltransferase
MRSSSAMRPGSAKPLADAALQAQNSVSSFRETMPRSIQYRINGGTPLKGRVAISGSKNAALPLMAAALCCDGVTTLTNVPRLRDIETMRLILDFLGAETTMEGTTLMIDATNVKESVIPHELVSKLRGSIVLLGPLLARFGRVRMSYPGGCVLGKRPVSAHIRALTAMGAVDTSTDAELRLEGKLKPSEVTLEEFSVTATENVLLAASLLPGITRIELAASEPHVQDVCSFLQKRGVTVDGVGSHSLVIHGKGELLEKGTHTVISDYLEAGAFLIAGIATKGHVTVTGADHRHLTSFIGALRRAGAAIHIDSATGSITADGKSSKLIATRIQTNIFPGFPTDLQAPFGVLLTQAEGVGRIFEVLFEGRMAYLYELEKMGANVEILNSHQALVIGPSRLHGKQVASNDIRAGVAMVIAGLCASGETVVTDVQYIERGYDRLEEKLTSLGANIVREEA